MVRPIPPPRRWLWLIAAAAVTAAVVAAWLATRPAGAPAAGSDLAFVDGRWRPLAPGDPRRPLRRAHPAQKQVRVEGQVVEAFAGEAVAGAEVVFAAETGEATTTSDASGRYHIDLVPGFYRAYVRGEGVISVGRPRYERLPGPPSARDVGAPDDTLAPVVGVFLDQSGVDLEVVRGGHIAGRVFDPAGRPVAGALVRLRADLRPVLGTDVAETDLDGSFHLEAPIGYWPLEVAHDGFAGLDPTVDAHVEVVPGDVAHVDLTLALGCIVRGRVVRGDGSPGGDGAIERRASDGVFEPAGAIAPDGTFRWSTTADADVVLRAWPWKAPPSPEQRFTCRPGDRRADVVFTVPDGAPDLEGTIVAADGTPAAGAYLDIFPRSPGGMSQQERADSQGRWAIYALPAGAYTIMASAAGAGIVERRVTVPARAVELRLGGTGAMAGRVAGVDRGSLTVELDACHGPAGALETTRTRRVVAVTGGQYRIDDLPACTTTAVLRAGRRVRVHPVTIPAGDVASVDVDFTPRRRVVVYGLVRGPDGRAVAGGTGYVLPMDEQDAGGARFTIGDDGRYRVEATVGDLLEAEAAGDGEQRLGGAGRVTGDGGDEERVDITLAPRPGGDAEPGRDEPDDDQ
jgi:hypothetical protein